MNTSVVTSGSKFTSVFTFQNELSQRRRCQDLDNWYHGELGQLHQSWQLTAVGRFAFSRNDKKDRDIGQFHSPSDHLAKHGEGVDPVPLLDLSGLDHRAGQGVVVENDCGEEDHVAPQFDQVENNHKREGPN